MTTLGDLFDVARARLRAAAETPLAALGPQERAGVVLRLELFLEQLHASLSTGGSDAPSAKGELAVHVRAARASLHTAQEMLPVRTGTGVAEGLVHEATRALAAAGDLVAGHRGADGEPLTAYAAALSTREARDHLTRRSAELAYEAGHVSYALSLGEGHPGAAAALLDVRLALGRGLVLSDARVRDAGTTVDSLPLALPCQPVRVSPAETSREGARRLAEDCERLSRAAFETLRGRSGHRLSGSDIQDLSKWLALGHFLSGRLLLHVAQQSPEAGAWREAAAALRTAAVAWQQASAAWHRVVDLADPRHHPALPKAPYRLRHLGRVVHLPRVDPHPAVVTAWTSALRVGRLLYGPEWTAERREPAMRPRPVEDVLADCGGPGALAAALYRLPATGWQLALAVPLAVRRAHKGLVTDDIEGRPADLDGGLPFYPVSQQQVHGLVRVHEAVLRPEQTAASTLIHAAGRCGTPVPRARLDAAAHNVLVREAGWEAQPPRAVQRPRRQTLPPERPRVGRGGLSR